MKAAKTAQVIIIFRTFVREDLISVTFLIRQTQHFICLINGFRAIDYPSPLVSTRHFHILCKICEHIYRQSFCWHKWGGGERYAIKLFLISICFIVKKHSFCPKLSPCSIPKRNYSIIIKYCIQGNFSARTVLFDEALFFFSKTIGIHTPTTVRAPSS